MPLNEVIAGLSARRNGPTRARASDSVDEDDVMEDDAPPSDDTPSSEDDTTAEADESDEPDAAEASGSYADGVVAGRAEATQRI